jgi:hypothetical protein
MNPFFKPNDAEEQLITLINKYNNHEFAVIRMTFTMLDKSTIDASGQIREVLMTNSIVNYKELIPGGKILYAKALVLKDVVHERIVSYYRPKSKNGDPRFCIYKLKHLVPINTLVYFTVLNDLLIAIPLIPSNTLEYLLKDVFPDVESDHALIQLKLMLIKIKNAGWIRSVSPFIHAQKM